MNQLTICDLITMTDAELNSIPNDIIAGKHLAYGINNYEPWGADNTPRAREILANLRNRLQKINSEKLAAKTAAQPALILCKCGCTIARINVMATCRDTSCPNCYDRMSE